MGMVVQYSLPYTSEYYSIWVLPYTTPYTLPFIHIALTGSIYRSAGGLADIIYKRV
jgi:hypothetical protein